MKTSTFISLLAIASAAAPLVAQDIYSTDLTPTTENFSYITVEGAYGFNENSGKDAVDVSGALLTLSIYESAGEGRKHEFVAQTGFLSGSEKNSASSAQGNTSTNINEKTSLRNCPLLLGYNCNFAISDKALFYVGGKAGVSFNTQEYKWSTNSYNNADGTSSGDSTRTRDNKTGGAFSVGAGFRFSFNESVDAIIGYDFYKTYANFQGAASNPGYHVIHAGLSFGF